MLVTILEEWYNNSKKNRLKLKKKVKTVVQNDFEDLVSFKTINTITETTIRQLNKICQFADEERKINQPKGYLSEYILLAKVITQQQVNEEFYYWFYTCKEGENIQIKYHPLKPEEEEILISDSEVEYEESSDNSSEEESEESSEESSYNPSEESSEESSEEESEESSEESSDNSSEESSEESEEK